MAVNRGHFHCDFNGSDTKCRAILIIGSLIAVVGSIPEVRSQVQNLEQVYYAREVETKHVHFGQTTHPCLPFYIERNKCISSQPLISVMKCCHTFNQVQHKYIVNIRALFSFYAIWY